MHAKEGGDDEWNLQDESINMQTATQTFIQRRKEHASQS